MLILERAARGELCRSLLQCVVHSLLCVSGHFWFLRGFSSLVHAVFLQCHVALQHTCECSTLCPLCVCLCVRFAIAVCCRWVVCTQVAPVVASNICFGVVVPLGCFSIGFPQAGPKAVTSARLCQQSPPAPILSRWFRAKLITLPPLLSHHTPVLVFLPASVCACLYVCVHSQFSSVAIHTVEAGWLGGPLLNMTAQLTGCVWGKETGRVLIAQSMTDPISLIMYNRVETGRKL